MSNVLMCVGARSDTPYYMKHFDTQLYSIEELCYIITMNAFLLEEEDFDEDLIVNKVDKKIPSMSQNGFLVSII